MPEGLGKRTRAEPDSTSESEESEWSFFDEEQDEQPRDLEFGNRRDFMAQMVIVALTVLMRLAGVLEGYPYTKMVQ